jgi:hypothetical protein
MWFYVQMWFPLLTVGLTAAICFSVVSFIMGRSVKPRQPKSIPHGIVTGTICCEFIRRTSEERSSSLVSFPIQANPIL